MSEIKDMLVEKLMKVSGLDSTNATNKVEEMMGLLTGLTEEEMSNAISKKIMSLATRRSTGEKMEVYILGAGVVEDSNSYAKWQAKQMYDENPDDAITRGFVKLEGENVIPLDTKEFFDEEKTKKNPGFGKPIKERMQRKTYALKNDE